MHLLADELHGDCAEARGARSTLLLRLIDRQVITLALSYPDPEVIDLPRLYRWMEPSSLLAMAFERTASGFVASAQK